MPSDEERACDLVLSLRMLPSLALLHDCLQHATCRSVAMSVIERMAACYAVRNADALKTGSVVAALASPLVPKSLQTQAHRHH